MPEKKIIQITSMDSTKFGGLEKYFLELTRYSEKKDIKMIIQYNNNPKSKSYLDELRKTSATIRITPLNENSIRSIINVFKLIKSIKPEIIHCHFINRNLKIFIPIFSRLFRVKRLYYSVHGGIDYKKYRYIRFFLNKFERFFPVSQEVFDRLVKTGIDKKRISLNYLGLCDKPVNSSELREKYRKEFGIKPYSVLLACIAFDSPLKGIDLLLKALSNINPEQKNVELMIIGIDPNNSKLLQLSKELGVSKYIHWVGIHDKASEILNAADIYIQPSRTEGLALAILEAMSQKLPVLATNVGGIPEAVINGKTGIVVEANLEEEIRKGILFLLEHPNERKEMGFKGYERFLNLFDGKRSVKNLVDNYYV